MFLICQNVTVRVCGAWIKIYYILCSKTYNTFSGLFWSPIGSRRAARGTRICETHLLARSCKQLHLVCLPDPWNLPGTILFSGKLPSSFEIHWVRLYFGNVVSFVMKDLWIYVITINGYAGPVHIFPNFCHCTEYRKISNISRTKSPNLNDSRLV